MNIYYLAKERVSSMGTALHSFINIFNQSFESNNQIVELKNIVIPIIQRDYAQGREGAAASRIRERFLDSLYKAVTGTPITLDFVYGDIDEKGIMTPLDGQQRLTTLYLLHWYAAKAGNISRKEYEFLKHFTYETRYSARDFCEALIKFSPNLDNRMSEEIIDQPWFPLDWKKDPTIRAMLVMIDAISEKFCDVTDLWDRLKGNAIRFYFLPVKDMGLTDELYIKMNSRGKPLTVFEHFKAEFEHEIKTVDVETAERIMQKIDTTWTEMLWQYRDSDNIIDYEFLNYFKFICDLIRYRNGDSPQGKSNDELDLIKECFGNKNPEVKANIRLLEECFDCWEKLNISPKEFCASFMSHSHETGKIRIDNRNDIDIFGDCLENYGKMTGSNRKFPLNRYVLLFAIITYLKNTDRVSESEFARRIRIVNNLIMNSEDEVSDSVSRTGGNRMPAIIKQVESIMLSGIINMELEINFNLYQLLEEKEKLQWTKDNPDSEELLFELEDHNLLFGQIGIIGLEYKDLFLRFYSLFECSYDAIDCAMLAIGDYSQTERNGWRYQMGSGDIVKAWISLFHKSAATGMDNTHDVLISLLKMTENFSDDFLYGLANEYLEKCEKESMYDWRYYYIGYEDFRPGRYGKIWWRNKQKEPYELYLLWTERHMSQNAYNPFLAILDWDFLSRDDLGQYIIIGNTWLECKTGAYILYDMDSREEIERFDIPQNDMGIDVVNRIEAVKSWYKSIKKKYM